MPAKLTANEKRIRRELEKDYRRKQRERIAELRAHLRHAKRWRASRLKKVRILCRHGRKMAREAAAVLRAEHRAAAKREVEALQLAERKACEARKAQALTKATSAIDRARLKWADEVSSAKAVKVWSAAPKLTKAQASKRIAERRAESDSEVEGNIPAELIPAWRKVKDRMKASRLRTRTEAFIEWASEHADLVRQYVDADLEASIAQLVRHEAQHRRELGQGRKALAGLSHAELSRRHRELSQGPRLAPAPF